MAVAWALVTVLAFVIGVVVLVVGLALSIALHEIGHLAPAKLFGVRVGQYMIGFGPTLFRTRIGETEYGVKALPLGGFISMSGMYPPTREQSRARGMFATMIQDARDANAETLDPDAERGAFYQLPVYKRVIIMLGGPLMNLILAIVFFAIVFSGIGIQQGTTTIAAVDECVVASGSSQTECTPDDPVAPAAEGGILPGDVIREVDGTAVSTFDEVAALIQRSAGEAVPVVVERGGENVSLSVTPLLTAREMANEDGSTTVREVGFVGMTAQQALVPQPLWSGPQAALEQTGRVAQIMAQLPVRIYDTAVDLFTGSERDPDGPLSVVGAGRLAGEIAAVEAPVLNRVSALLGVLGSLNIALFVFNLIPLLPLDGGHIAVALWDGVKRGWAKLTGRGAPKPVDATKLVPVTFAVVIALFVMGAILILADVFNPVDLLG